MEILAKRIKELRKEYKMTQADLALHVPTDYLLGNEPEKRE